MAVNPIEQHFRAMTDQERSMIMKLLEPVFPGREALIAQVPYAKVRKVFDDGTLDISIDSGPTAAVEQRVPVNVLLWDTDGIPIEILLHVVDGKMNELEIVTFSDDPIRISLNPDKWRPELNIPEQTGRSYE